jgi:hypothetical protein
MATLHERERYREAVMKTLYEAVEGNRLPGLTSCCSTGRVSDLQVCCL